MILMTAIEIVGNVVAIFGMLLFFISAVLKTKNKILFTQTISHLINIASEICIGIVNPESFSATIGEATNIVRNGFILKNKNTKPVSIILIVLSTIIGILVNVFLGGNKLIGYIPVATSLVYSIIVLLPNARAIHIKGAMIFSTACFSTYSFLVNNLVMGIGNAIISLTTIISLIALIKEEKKEKNDGINNQEKEKEND